MSNIVTEVTLLTNTAAESSDDNTNLKDSITSYSVSLVMCISVHCLVTDSVNVRGTFVTAV